jgi:ferrous iron transport protein B
MSSPSAAVLNSTRTVALAGNPNCGKTTLFNALTGLRQKVGNYPGVTVEKKEGRLRVESADLALVDLPGIYTLAAQSLDERVTRNVLLGWQEGATRPDAVVAIIDASNLERNLYLVSQLTELGRPVLLALNMMDMAEKRGLDIDLDVLSDRLGIPVFPVVASKGTGLDKLKAAMAAPPPPVPVRRWRLPEEVEVEVATLTDAVIESGIVDPAAAEGEAIRLLLNDLSEDDAVSQRYAGQLGQLHAMVTAARERLESQKVDWRAAEAEARYGWIQDVCAEATGIRTVMAGKTLTDRIDAVLTHRVFGFFFFAGLMLVMFQSIFSFAQIPMDWIGAGVDWLGDGSRKLIPPGMLQDLVAGGIIPGVGAVVTFLPQILILTFFIALLEDTGYMSRAAFIMDRVMRQVGLSGKSFIPLLSGFACAIPAITATRTIENAKDRLVTILITPLMSCSARLPVYALMIGAFFPPQMKVGKVFSLAAVVLFAMYALGIVAAVGMGWLFRKTLVKGESRMFVMEMPPYRLPVWRNVVTTMFSAGGQFLQRAGTVILALSIVLWALSSFPKNVQLSRDYDAEKAKIAAEISAGTLAKEAGDEKTKHLDDLEQSERSEKSYIGRAGKFCEPVLQPLGFNWKIGVGVISAFAAREVLVGTLAIIYGVGKDADESSDSLREALQADRYPDGRPVFTPLVAVSLMVFFVLALQCISTFAVVRRETNGWKWPLFQLGYMTALAYVGSLIVYQGGRWLGFQ